MSFTHGLEHFWAKTPKSKLKFIKNGLNIMLSDSWKSAFKMASEKVRKTWNCPASLAISEALTIYSTNFLRPPFNSQFFLSLNFYFGCKTPCGLKAWEN